jgi:hypothetical protein
LFFSALEHIVELIERFGNNITLPGVLCGNKQWLGADHQDLHNSIRSFCVDHILSSKESSAASITTARQDIDFVPSDDEDYIIHVEGNRNPWVMPAFGRRNGPENCTTTTTTSSLVSSVFQDIIFPNGGGGRRRRISVPYLTRLLSHALEHQVYDNEEDGSTYYFVRGIDAIPTIRCVLEALGYSGDSCPKGRVIAFGQMLIDRGILCNYTPHCQDFEKTFLVVQPLWAPQVLNSFVVWPATTTARHSVRSATSSELEEEAEDPMDVILRLSHQMDEICSQLSEGHNDVTRAFEDFEVAVCQLQRVNFPVDPVEHVTFAINLFNLVIRHAMILTMESRNTWSWPRKLEELQPFFRKVGYHVAGEWIDLAHLQASLYGLDDGPTGSNKSPRPVSSSRNSKKKPVFWNRILSAAGRGRRAADAGADKSNNIECQNETPAIRTDPKILFVTTWGTQSSPVGLTVYPNRLQECLRTATEVYCREHVKVMNGNYVVLPALLSWHCQDFGGSSAIEVLKVVLPFLSSEQKRQIRTANRDRTLEATFANDSQFCWECGLAPPTSQKKLAGATPPPTSFETSHKKLGGATPHPTSIEEDQADGPYHSAPLYAKSNKHAVVRGRGKTVLWGNRASIGRDMQLVPPERSSRVAAPPLEETEKTDYEDYYLGDLDFESDEFSGDSVPEPPPFHSDMSAMTMGSEFEIPSQRREKRNQSSRVYL